MGRTLAETPITTRSARANLAAGLYWRAIDPEVHLGYRKLRAGGKWLVRYYQPALQSYKRIALGTADDVFDEGTLSYNAAVASARDAVSKTRRSIELQSTVPAGTVGTAAKNYIAVLDARTSANEGRQTRSATSGTLRRHVLDNPPFAELRLDQLTEEHLADWASQLGDHLKQTRKQRIVNDLKAALNAAHRTARKYLPKDFGDVVRFGLTLETFGAVETEDDIIDHLILGDDTVRAIVKACFDVDPDLDFGRLVICLAATGARFSQLRRMKVRDVQTALQRLMVPKSRKGGRFKKGGYTPVRVGQDVLAALRPVLEGRSPDEPLFERWRHVQVSPMEWKRDSRGAWTTPSEMSRPWKAALERAQLPIVIPYALRHSSIVRGIREGLPIRLVAALHDTSVAMIERHYARFIADGLEDFAARAIVPMMAEAA